MQTVELFWDAASPYSYLISTRLPALAARHGVALRWRPFLLGGVFNAVGNRMPASVPAKGRYLVADLQLWARYYGVPLHMPETFPVNSLLAMRVACLADAHGLGGDYALAVLRAGWGERQDVSRPETLATLLASLGLDGAALLDQAVELETKEALRAATDEAVARGAFGAPTLFLGDRMLWGNDRLPLLEEMLEGRL
jgi:2-hydroxychromene-2-carboxylate isomerase